MMVDPSAVAVLPAKKLVHAEYLLSMIKTFFQEFHYIILSYTKHFELFPIRENIEMGIKL
jgi:hypothetical protein